MEIVLLEVALLETGNEGCHYQEHQGDECDLFFQHDFIPLPSDSLTVRLMMRRFSKICRVTHLFSQVSCVSFTTFVNWMGDITSLEVCRCLKWPQTELFGVWSITKNIQSIDVVKNL